MSFRRFVLPIIGITTAVGTLMVFAAFGTRTALPLLLTGVLPGIATTSVLGLLVVGYFKVVLHAHGIRGYNFWGLSASLTWQEIASVKPVNLFGYRFLRLAPGSAGSALWLPLFLQDMGAVRSAVLEYAPPHSPMRAYFERYRT